LPDAEFTEEQLDEMFLMGDRCGSGTIGFEDFVTTLCDVLDDATLEHEVISVKLLAERWIGLSSSEMSQNPEVIFDMAWSSLKEKHGGEDRIALPREIMFLGGAPGAGKGTMTPHIMRERGLGKDQSISMSSLLNSPAAKRIIDQGGLVSDMEVFSILLEALSKPDKRLGALVDGFPRTVTQVELLRLLHSKMDELSRGGADKARCPAMPRPHFRMGILYVDEKESIRRQLSRGQQALEHNKQVEEAGEGELMEVRETDLSVKAAQTRYRLFVEDTMAANDALKRLFPFNMINATGTVEEVKHIVMQELAYQSSLELAEETYGALAHIPTAAEVTRHARQNLVARLDSYQQNHPRTFASVVSVIEKEFLPAIRRHALIGEARITMTTSYLVGKFGGRQMSAADRMRAVDMAVDIMFDRGFALRAEERTGVILFKITCAPREAPAVQLTHDPALSSLSDSPSWPPCIRSNPAPWQCGQSPHPICTTLPV
jgi:adenylate kinase